ncbi:MAG TPA: FadR/GntR family transcriptional regulator [bacterium]|nr:FadR/GntR family transcriptional regulator [bacterium]
MNCSEGAERKVISEGALLSSQTVRKHKISETVAKQLQREISLGRFKVGEKLPSDLELAKRYQVGRTAIREAFRILEFNGHIAVRAGNSGGAYVCRPNHSIFKTQLEELLRMDGVSVGHLYEVRLALEPVMLETALECATAADLAALRENVARSEACFQEGRNQEKIRETFEFHILLAEMTHNPIYVFLMKAIIEIMFQSYSQVMQITDFKHIPVEDHRRLLRHIENRDVFEAKKELIQHIEEINEAVTKEVHFHDFVLKKG